MPDGATEPESTPTDETARAGRSTETVFTAPDDGELELPYWLTSTEEAANTTFLQMVRRLPRLLRRRGCSGGGPATAPPSRC
ncbi:hypothetical protein [Actinoplanes sp. NPDC049802]|uniref:hypothetical protein n=1 Tax=Actinoplanes sp. NPDC049802 TaxID=3154742 RepID=UPI0033D9FEA7